jgi:hypothetical protein
MLVARLTSYVGEITGDLQYGFRLNRSTTDQMLWFSQALDKCEGVMERYISSYRF